MTHIVVMWMDPNSLLFKFLYDVILLLIGKMMLVHIPFTDVDRPVIEGIASTGKSTLMFPCYNSRTTLSYSPSC